MKTQLLLLGLVLGGSVMARAQAPTPVTQPRAAPTPPSAVALPSITRIPSAPVVGAPLPVKVGVIEIQGVMTGTQEGQKVIAELEGRQEPKKKDLQKQQADIQDLQGKLQRGANTLADAAKQDLARTIDQKSKRYQRDMEDAEAGYQDDLRKIMNDLEQKILPVIDRYAVANGYAVLLEVDNQNTPVVYFDPSTNITKQIIEAYDKASPSPAPPAKPAAAAPKPATPAPKKQP
jgi:outer membrane protein